MQLTDDSGSFMAMTQAKACGVADRMQSTLPRR